MNATFVAMESERPVRLDLGESRPRAGRALRGQFVLEQGVLAGETFEVRLRCSCEYSRWTNSDGDTELVTDQPYEQIIPVPATGEKERWVVPFEFEVNATMPASVPGSESKADYAWHLALISERKGSPYEGSTNFVLQFAAASPAEVRAALAANETPEVTRKIEQYMQSSGITLRPHERFRLGQSPEALEMAVKTREMANSLSKGCLMVFAAMVALFFALPLVPLVIGVWRHFFNGAS